MVKVLQYVYRASDQQGKIVAGREQADSKEQLVQKLKQQGKFPFEIREEIRFSLSIFKISRFSKQDRLTFTQQLAGLLSAGIPLEKALGILGKLTTGGELGKVIAQLRRLLQEGLSFSAALERFPRYFPPLFLNMIRAGETGGILPQVLKRLAQYLEEEINLRRFIIGSLFYPGIVMLACLGAILFYVAVVIPKFQTIFDGMGSELPVITKVVMFFGKGLQNFWWVFMLVVIVGAIWLSRELATAEGRYRFDRFKLKIPLLGNVLEKIATSKMSLALSLLSGSGVPLLTSLSISSDIVGNAVIAKALREVEQDVRKGNSLAGSMGAKEIFPVLAVEMIGVGEESGNLTPMLEQVARTYEGEVKYSLNLFLSIFEPLLIIVMVGVIAILAIAILLPIMNMNSEINTLG